MRGIVKFNAMLAVAMIWILAANSAQAIEDGPKEIFEKVGKATEAGDWKTVLNHLTKEAGDEMVGTMVEMIVGFNTEFIEDDGEISEEDLEELKQMKKAADQLAKKYKLEDLEPFEPDFDFDSEATDDPDAMEELLEEMEQKMAIHYQQLAAEIKDKPVFLKDAAQAFEWFFEEQGQLYKGDLKDIKIDDKKETASATIQVTVFEEEVEIPVTFKRENSVWKMGLPDFSGC